MYLGLALALLALGVKFFQEALHCLGGILTLAETDLVLSVLSLIDIVLVGSLIVMVMLSGGLHRRDLLHTPAAHLHERRSHAERQDPLVCRVTSDIRRLGRPARCSRPDRFRLPSRLLRQKFPRPSTRNSHLATRHDVVQLHLCSASHIECCRLTAGRPASIHNLRVLVATGTRT